MACRVYAPCLPPRPPCRMILSRSPFRRCVATAVPLRSFRKMGTMLINAPRMQHVCMATGFKALEQAHRGFLR